MNLNFRFAIASDLHIALPETIWDHPSRFHLVEVSIPALEVVLEDLENSQLDFLLIPGDLTQHGEPSNHIWLANRLSKLPFPVYVIPGNHDVPSLLPNEQSIGFTDFPSYYQSFGYQNNTELYYTYQLLPGVQLISLNSNIFDGKGQQLGRIDEAQLTWLESVLASIDADLIIVMVHHNLLEHLPGQSHHSLGKRYMLENAPEVLKLLHQAGVKLVFTGHLHVQDVAYQNGLYDITTGSLVSYPHPYRILEVQTDSQGVTWLEMISKRVETLPEFPTLSQMSRDWIGDRSLPFTLKLLTETAVPLSDKKAYQIALELKYFWADVAGGDADFDFPNLPTKVREYFEKFGAIAPDGKLAFIDNHSTFLLEQKCV
ncbi:metallophosphoesterase family protein [Merismopedia glauca]|uniref:Metallophosphoesterase n=1 Tax=Merismopedia glauca CCAP 1448/3 TaxID=1296344 RepID=A0A2T1C8L8_9CYAN|nr:metallophosphoesterase [Merismopedia glauca]PSB04589.1 metallophosphoesterase [Merismopedia glauca CCAP 1448/3]